MIVVVSDFDIKSPLPARQISVPDENESKTVGPEPVRATIEEQPKASAAKMAPKLSLTRYWPIAAIVIVIFLIVMVVFKFLIPNLKGATGQTVSELTYWGLWEDSNIIQGLLAEFESKNPGIKVKYIKNSKTDYRSRLQGRLSKSGGTEEVPDVFRIHATWLPMMKDYLAPVPGNVAGEIQLESDFFDTYKNDLKEDGKYWAIPLMYDGLSMFYNKDILDSAGLAIPKTWWGFRDVAKKITVKDEFGKISIAGAAMGVTENVDHWSDIVGAMIKQNGVDLLKGGEANLKKLKGVLTFYTLFKTSDQIWNETLPASTLFFASGKLAFYFAPSWRIFDIEQINPALKFEVGQIPQLATLEGSDPEMVEKGQVEGNLTNIQWSTYWAEGVSNKSKNQKDAWKLLAFLASKESLEKFYQSASQVRSFGEIYPRKSMATSLSSQPKLKAWVETANSASNWYLSSRTFDDGINDEMITYFGDAINGIVQKNTPIDDVVPTLINGINRTVSKYGIKRM